MLANHLVFGKKKGGYTKMILEGGSNGIVDIIWAEEEKMTTDKLKDGTQYQGMLDRLEKTAGLGIFFVDLAKDRHFFIGLMTQEKCNFWTKSQKRYN